MKKRRVKPLSLELNFDDLRWCIENDFQVYLVPLKKCISVSDYKEYSSTGEFKIGVRRKGISTNGLDKLDVNGREVFSYETLSDKTFDNYYEAIEHLNYVYRQLRERYG